METPTLAHTPVFKRLCFSAYMEMEMGAFLNLNTLEKVFGLFHFQGMEMLYLRSQNATQVLVVNTVRHTCQA